MAVANASHGTVQLVSATILFTPEANFNGQASFDYTIDDGHGGTDTGSVGTVTEEAVNDAPVITSDGGGATASLVLDENVTAVTRLRRVRDIDQTPQPLAFSIAGGNDAARFSIDAGTGVLSFTSAPDYEHPSDADGDNVYNVIVEVSDGEGGTNSQAIAVTVTRTDVDDTPPSIVSIVATDPTRTNAATIDYTVTFSEAVTGVDASQFAVATTGNITGASVDSVTEIAGSNGTQYTVAVNTGTGDGTIALQLAGAAIHDLAGNGLPGGAFHLTQTTLTGVVGATADLNGDGKQDLIADRRSMPFRSHLETETARSRRL